MPLLPEDVPALGTEPLPARAKQKSGAVDRMGTDLLLESQPRGPGWGCGMGQRRGGLGSVAAHTPLTGWAGGPSGWHTSAWLVYNRVNPVPEECHAGEEVGAPAAGPPGPGGHAVRQAVADEGGAPVPLQGGRRVRATQAQPPYSAPTQNHCSCHPQILSPSLALGTCCPAACTLFPQLCWVNSYLQLRSQMPPGTPCCPGLGLSRARPCLDT